MPADRMIHPRLGHSEKVSNLTDLEYRVYMQTLLSADDFGVLRFSAITVQADSDALAARPTKAIQRALDVIKDFGLLMVFDHQNRVYACHPNWQDYQKIEYPRETFQPKPDAETMANCSPKTQHLFDSWPVRGRRTVSEPIPNGTQTEAQLARAQAPDTAKANGKRQTAKANAAAFDAFWAAYPRKVAKGAASRAWGRLLPSAELGVVILAAVERQRASPQWTKDGGQFIPHPATWLSQERWLDETTRATRVNGIEVQPQRLGGVECEHDPPCDTQFLCAQRRKMDAGKLLLEEPA
jgi:hypothetical protein